MQAGRHCVQVSELLDNQCGRILANGSGIDLASQGEALVNRDGVLASRQDSARLQLATVDNQRGQLNRSGFSRHAGAVGGLPRFL